MRLVHHSAAPLTLDRTRTYDQNGIASHVGKPAGLWVSDESEGAFGWREWCEGEEWNLGGLTHETEFVLAPDAKVLTLTSEEHLVGFTKEYGIDPTDRGYGMGIDWRRVASEYDGILITPYHWRHRLSLMWYYGWDCASGCFWNLDALAPVDSARAMTP